MQIPSMYSACPHDVVQSSFMLWANAVPITGNPANHYDKKFSYMYMFTTTTRVSQTVTTSTYPSVGSCTMQTKLHGFTLTCMLYRVGASQFSLVRPVRSEGSQSEVQNFGGAWVQGYSMLGKWHFCDL